MIEKILHILQDFRCLFVHLGGITFCYNLFSAAMWGLYKKKINMERISYHTFSSLFSSICLSMGLSVSSIEERNFIPAICLLTIMFAVQMFTNVGFIALGDFMNKLAEKFEKYIESDEYKHTSQSSSNGLNWFWFIMWLIKK